MQGHTLLVSRTARYFTLGTPSASIRQVWIVCHGYGQLAEYFLRKFAVLEDGYTLIAAPEGLSRFYLTGTSGRVGASWMTKEERQSEIEDHTGYLDTLAGQLLSQVPAEARLFVLGFSQGVATACRWLAKGTTHCHGLVLWAGVFPPDLDPGAAFHSLQHTPLVLVSGRTDAYITEEAAASQLDLLSRQGLKPVLHWYEGGHEVEPALLQTLHQAWCKY